MPRPTEFVDLKQTSVMVERALLEEAKKRDINVSDVLRGALEERIGELPPRKNGPLKKFKGLPKHLVREAARKMMHVPWTDEKIAAWFNKATGADVTPGDLQALVPRF